MRQIRTLSPLAQRKLAEAETRLHRGESIMNSEHLVDLRPHGEPRQVQDELQDILSDAWAIGTVLAAYDHVLFDSASMPLEPWCNALKELLGARSRIIGGIIPRRLKSYREIAA